MNFFDICGRKIFFFPWDVLCESETYLEDVSCSTLRLSFDSIAPKGEVMDMPYQKDDI